MDDILNNDYKLVQKLKSIECKAYGRKSNAWNVLLLLSKSKLEALFDNVMEEELK